MIPPPVVLGRRPRYNTADGDSRSVDQSRNRPASSRAGVLKKMELISTFSPCCVELGGKTCENCGAVGASDLELSRLVESDGELIDTELLCIDSYCDGCAASLTSKNWGALRRRAAARQRLLPLSAVRIVN